MAHLSANIHVLPWYRSQQIVEQTPNTLIYSLVRTPERESQFIWLLPLCRLDISFYRLKSRTDIHINTLSDARRYVVAVASGQPSEAFLRQHDFSSEDNLVPLTSLEQSAGMMEKSRVDLVFGASQFLENLVSQNQAQNEWIKVLTVNELSKQTYLAANKDSRGDVLNALQAAVQLFVESEPNDTECSTTEQP
ncbi:substrate-binding periplasmic protein [Pseudoalteromonas fenneropenaei]|uniref:Substrate-binding periplasmic protein n=1 Tax=Pseudoalteromonas fenneropenaei TaxID=1737459 RepID=A0ABV7CMV3_9GAMM